MRRWPLPHASIACGDLNARVQMERSARTLMLLRTRVSGSSRSAAPPWWSVTCPRRCCHSGPAAVSRCSLRGCCCWWGCRAYRLLLPGRCCGGWVAGAHDKEVELLLLLLAPVLNALPTTRKRHGDAAAAAAASTPPDAAAPPAAQL